MSNKQIGFKYMYKAWTRFVIPAKYGVNDFSFFMELSRAGWTGAARPTLWMLTKKSFKPHDGVNVCKWGGKKKTTDRNQSS